MYLTLTEIQAMDLLKLRKIKMARYYPPEKIVRTKQYYFSDATNIGYGACLRCNNGNDRVHCSFVMAKPRVSPAWIKSILRLELSVAVISVGVPYRKLNLKLI